MAIVNLTPHHICTADADGNIISTYPASGDVARCAPAPAQDGAPVDGIPVSVRPVTPGPVVGLPGPVDGVTYIGSAVVLNHPDVVGRSDVVAPGTGPADNAVRNDKGHVVAVRCFVRAVL